MPKQWMLCLVLMLVAAGVRAESGWTDYGAVVELTPTIHERFDVILDVSKNPSDCREEQGFYLVYSFSGAIRMYELFLEALIHGRKVRVFVTGNCNIDDYSEISAATIVPR